MQTLSPLSLDNPLDIQSLLVHSCPSLPESPRLPATRFAAHHYSSLTWSRSDTFLSLPSSSELSQEETDWPNVTRVGIYDKRRVFPEASAK